MRCGSVPVYWLQGTGGVQNLFLDKDCRVRLRDYNLSGSFGNKCRVPPSLSRAKDGPGGVTVVLPGSQVGTPRQGV